MTRLVWRPRRQIADQTKPRLKMQWSVEAQKDFKAMHEPDLANVLTKNAVDDMIKDSMQAMFAPRNLLQATK